MKLHINDSLPLHLSQLVQTGMWCTRDGCRMLRSLTFALPFDSVAYEEVNALALDQVLAPVRHPTKGMQRPRFFVRFVFADEGSTTAV